MWNLVSDSTCDLRLDEFHSETVRFETVPLRIRVGDREFLDQDGLDVPEMLAAMSDEKAASSSACPSPVAFARAMEKGNPTICFTISSALSGSFNSAQMGRELVLEDHPERKICVIDSKSTAGAVLLLVRKAKELMEADPAGEHFDDICAQLRLYQAAQRTVFTLENFDNLIKNGRMRPLVGTLLHSLGIHVVASATPQGTIHVESKARGAERTRKAIVSYMAQSKDCTGVEVLIHHCENPSAALRLKEEILRELPVKSVETRYTRGLNSFYAMEKGLIVGY